jgi:hypothetical protein
MAESPEIKCVKCGTICHKTFVNTRIETYVRGNGIVKDRAGAKRDMNLYHLTHDDPYRGHREIGEKDHLATKLRNAGKHQRNPTIIGPKKRK